MREVIEPSPLASGWSGRPGADMAGPEERVMRLTTLGMAASGLVHDVSNLLWPIRSRLQRLAVHRVGPTADEDLAAIESCIDYLAALARATRLLSNQSPAPDGDGEPTQLSRWWHEAQRLVASAVPRGVRIVSDLGESDLAVRIAPLFLTQAVVNLVHNAGEALAGQANAEVRLSAARDDDGVVLTVRDNGPGLPFDSLAGLPGSYSSKAADGTRGFGLMLVSELIAHAGGELRAQSLNGCGAAFMLIMPASDSASPARQWRVTGTRPTNS